MEFFKVCFTCCAAKSVKTNERRRKKKHFKRKKNFKREKNMKILKAKEVYSFFPVVHLSCFWINTFLLKINSYLFKFKWNFGYDKSQKETERK